MLCRYSMRLEPREERRGVRSSFGHGYRPHDETKMEESMTDVGGGVYVSRIDTEDWQPDDEVGGSVHTLFEEGEAAGGLWKIEPDAGHVVEAHQLPARETIVVLEGTVRIEIQGRPTLELAAGDMASMPKGRSRRGTRQLSSRRFGSIPDRRPLQVISADPVT
jgi:quercetin dioxygenase-like cupin family protein